ncbi:Oidioi.mRNA.OKI2018_I69.chr1.g471.t1.cds [Oikopleura dioica]|uniref:Oidioi.mRNA.OKI2018_I69.chr1.g471.t1.cds n=1 Tax=Oikopleura dioica TaxID=34765 RepID=A0ABN7SQ56_OIKDI|nr:Oidioi.mRNA.OKI2018_I69.chr1.g471.t1.cds [Oikopleura dioica]
MDSGLKLWRRSEATSKTEKFAFSRNNAEKRACDSKIRTYFYGNKNRCGILEVKKRFVAERLDELDDKMLPGRPLTQRRMSVDKKNKLQGHEMQRLKKKMSVAHASHLERLELEMDSVFQVLARE